MDEMCCSRPAAGAQVCELPSTTVERVPHAEGTCTACEEKGKPLQRQTVKALLSVSLRLVQNVEYLFCSTPTCPIVYFSSDARQRFAIDQVRERVYQKESESDEVFICYCFRHTVGEIRLASTEERMAILDDINTGIQADQCACDLRNPQGSCCLGNVRGLIRQLGTATDSSRRKAGPGQALR